MCWINMGENTSYGESGLCAHNIDTILSSIVNMIERANVMLMALHMQFTIVSSKRNRIGDTKYKYLV